MFSLFHVLIVSGPHIISRPRPLNKFRAGLLPRAGIEGTNLEGRTAIRLEIRGGGLVSGGEVGINPATT